MARGDLQFQVGEYVFLKVSPVRGTLRFGQKGKLSQRYIGPFQIKSKINDVAYRLTLPPELSWVHNVFHISMLKKYVADTSHVLQHEPLDVRANMTYMEQPVGIIDTKEQVLRNKTIHWGEGTVGTPQSRRSYLGAPRSSEAIVSSPSS